MFSLVLSYVFLFLLAGAIGLAIGWMLRDRLQADRLRFLRDDIEAYRQAIAARRAQFVAAARAPAEIVIEESANG